MRLLRHAAVLALAAVPLANRATAEVSDTLTIVGTFRAAYGNPARPDLAAVLANGAEHTWTLTMYGVTSQHGGHRDTYVNATSFDLAFSGPDAATLDAVVGTHGGSASLEMFNTVDPITHTNFATWNMWLEGVELRFDQDQLSQEAFTSDADGYPIPSPQTLYADRIRVCPGSDEIVSLYDTLHLTGEVAPPPPPPPPPPLTMGIADGSVVEGNRGRSKVKLTVALSAVSSQTVTVNYRTMDGTALASSDYDSATGTLTFLPGERTKAITVSVKSDRVREADETFTVELSGAVGASIADGVAVATIRNDD